MSQHQDALDHLEVAYQHQPCGCRIGVHLCGTVTVTRRDDPPRDTPYLYCVVCLDLSPAEDLPPGITDRIAVLPDTDNARSQEDM